MLLPVPEAVLSHNERRSRSAVQSILCVAPRCPRGSLVPYINEEQISCSVQSLCCSALSQRQSHPIQKLGADQLCSPFSVLLLANPEAVSSHTNARSISSAGLSLRRELCLRDGLPCCIFLTIVLPVTVFTYLLSILSYL